MKNLYHGLLSVSLLLITLIPAMGQDVHFSQFHEAPLYRNPALAGIMHGDVRAQVVYRSQWNNITNAYKTGSFNFEYKTKAGQGDDYVTWALQTYYDKSGSADLSTTIVMPAINYHKSISSYRNSYLSAAFMGGLVQRRFDRSKLTTNNQYDNGIDGEGFMESQYSYWDGSAGLSFHTELGENAANNLVIGAAIHHLNKPKNSFFQASTATLDPKLVVSADLKMDVNETGTVTIYSDFIRQGPYSQAIGGVFYGLKFGALTDDPDYMLHGGLFLRWGDALIPTVKLDYKPFSVSVSYDINMSKLSPTSNGMGGFELAATYSGFLNKLNTSFEMLKCPRF
ncbi:MAG: PorP/SprF family type IX secretion system membrane protein [Chitinophagaceae bacterium]